MCNETPTNGKNKGSSVVIKKKGHLWSVIEMIKLKYTLNHTHSAVV